MIPRQRQTTDDDTEHGHFFSAFPHRAERSKTIVDTNRKPLLGFQRRSTKERAVSSLDSIRRTYLEKKDEKDRGKKGREKDQEEEKKPQGKRKETEPRNREKARDLKERRIRKKK
eukprot:TRINITY_DN1460_c0_g1_i2.p1 TRINITY_DN1460_c0_g1~~TRINITY_DN1460_c0_g1_i2.p1  ORF type:complete len:115 (+),score=34.14 TRINITY_DN1460_c0_g1_i2:196-540(+)